MITYLVAFPLAVVLVIVAVLATRDDLPQPELTSRPAITLLVQRTPRRLPHETLEMFASRTEQTMRRLNRELEVDDGRRQVAATGA